MTLAATAALLFVAGYGYLFLLGAAASIVLLPRRWQPLAVVAAPHLGWAALVAIGYPFNAALPFRVVALLLAGAALLVILVGPTPLAPLPAREGGTMAGVVAFRRAFRARAVAIVRRQPWREAGAPFLIGALTYAVAVAVHVRQGALSALVADSDVEHFADVVAALLHFPIGWSVGAQQGLEATPVGLAYHYVHAALSAITGLDTFSTALPSNFLLLALAVQAVYVFARSVLGLRPNLATLATGLYALGGLPLIVASFGWGQQTAALAAVPFGLAALHLGITGRDGRSLWCAGLAGSLAAGSLYLATAPLVGASAIAMALVSASREHWPVRRAPLPSERIDHDARAPLRSNRTPVPPESAAATLVASPALVVLGHGVDHTAPHIAAAAPVASPTLGRPAGGAPALPDRLRQMSAHAQMYPAALAAWTSPLVRLVRIGVIVAAAGALSHLSAAAFLLERASVGLLRADELTGRSTHVSTFVGPAEAFGVAPLELFRDVTTVGGEPLLVWSVTTATTLASMAAAAPLFVAGLIWSARTRPHLLSVLAVMTAYEVYLRWLRPFPYGEFKLLSSVWFVAPCLVAAGAGFVADRSSRWLDARPPAAQRRLATGIVSSVVSGAAGRPGTGPSPRGIAWLAAALFGAWLLLTHLHAIRFLSLPWGGVLPETAMADARAIVRAVPVGASVYVSGQLTPPVAYSTAWELTLHRAGFPSASARADYLGKRWRGVLTSLLAFGGRPVYGLARRHSAELRAPIRPEDAAYLLLDGTEDPRLYGDLPADLVASAGSLRLYRQAHRLFASAQDLRRPPLAIQGGSQVDTGAGVSAETEGDAADGGAGDRGAGDEGAWQLLLHLRIGGDGLFVVDGGQERAIAPHPGALPAPMMPVGESLPGRRGNLTTFPSLDLTPWPPLRAGEGERWPPGATAAAGTATGHLVIGLQAVAPAHVIITAREASGSAQPRALALMPGLTWYTTTELR
ncbi:MAG: hypothetical protein ACRDI2_07550, partial [Chloroflexota bacterium]